MEFCCLIFPLSQDFDFKMELLKCVSKLLGKESNTYQRFYQVDKIVSELGIICELDFGVSQSPENNEIALTLFDSP